MFSADRQRRATPTIARDHQPNRESFDRAIVSSERRLRPVRSKSVESVVSKSRLAWLRLRTFKRWLVAEYDAAAVTLVSFGAGPRQRSAGWPLGRALVPRRSTATTVRPSTSISTGHTRCCSLAKRGYRKSLRWALSRKSGWITAFAPVLVDPMGAFGCWRNRLTARQCRPASSVVNRPSAASLDPRSWVCELLGSRPERGAAKTALAGAGTVDDPDMLARVASPMPRGCSARAISLAPQRLVGRLRPTDSMRRPSAGPEISVVDISGSSRPHR